MWCGFQAEQFGHHELHLLFRRGAGARNGFLDFGGWILANGQRGLLGGKQNDAARVPQHNRRAHVARVEHILDRHGIRAMPFNQFRDAGVDVVQTRRQRVGGGRTNHSALKQRRGAAVV